MKPVIALAGNQNCGKSTLFNQLTGANQHVGNFPGVTVEHKEGKLKTDKKVSVIDLPGIYSLSPYTPEEVVTRDYIVNQRPNAIINIVDATNLQRNLYLTLQLIELETPIIIALNMMDEIRASGISIDIDKLSAELGVTIVPICALKNQGVEELMEQVFYALKNDVRPKRYDFCSGAVHRALHATAHLIEDNARLINYPAKFTASKILEGDDLLEEKLNLTEEQKDILMHIIEQMESDVHTDREVALIDMRYKFIEKLYEDCVYMSPRTKQLKRSIKLDMVLTHKFFAIPIFIGIMALIFYLTFDSLGLFLKDSFDALISGGVSYIDGLLTASTVSDWMHSFLIDGIFAGVGSVLSFLPVILLMFFFLSILEDSGYMARVAFVMDSALRKIGLSGRSFVPMIIGFGCSVPAIMATRTLASERDKKLTILVTPFMSCGAKLPIYALFCGAFFTQYQGLVMTSLYVFGIVIAIITGLLMKNTLFKGNPVPFVLELPAYRFPSIKSVIVHMWQKAKDFITRAFTVIFLASIVIWFLQSFDLSFNFITNNSQSILAKIGEFVSPIFAPLGFGNWESSTAVITGLAAKETVVSTLTVLTNGNLTGLFTPLSAYSFLVFVLLYMPCVAAMATTKRELGNVKGTIFVFAYQTAMAWLASFIVYNVGSLFLGG